MHFPALLAASPAYSPSRFISLKARLGTARVAARAADFAAVTGLAYNNTYCIVARIVNGRIREMTDYVDTELITRALFGAAPSQPRA